MKKYVFKPYDKSFPDLFRKEKERILCFIKPNMVIEHVGSTAVPDLGGKGIIDIAIAVAKEDTKQVLSQLESLGYEFREQNSTPDRLFFRAHLPDPLQGIRTYHIHLTYKESQDWHDLIAFRNYLIAHPEVARRYAELKKQAAAEVNENGEMYRKLKDPLFKEVLKKIED